MACAAWRRWSCISDCDDADKRRSATSASTPMPDGRRLTLVARTAGRYTFRAAMGPPTDVREEDLDVAGESTARDDARHGQSAVRRAGRRRFPTRSASTGWARRWRRIRASPAGTNVEFAQIEAPNTVRILIWERGVGPTTASGTGACAAAVAAIAHGGAARDIDVIAPGGTQRVEWRDDGVYLTGWAEVVFEGTGYLMQSFHQARDAAEIYSPAEEAFNRRRRTVGLFLAPAIFFAAPGSAARPARRGASHGCHARRGRCALAHRSATAGRDGAARAIARRDPGSAPARQALAPFADPIIFLFIGGFILAQAMFVHGVDRRIAYTALSLPAVRT